MLENENIILRAIEPEDLDLLFKWENDRSLWEISTTIAPFSKYILKKYIENSHLDLFEAKQLRLMIVAKEDDNKTVGAIDLFDFEPYHGRVGVGILVYEKSDRKKGYASQALQLIIDYTFNILGLRQVYCNITTDNVSSVNLFTNLGFEIIGVKKDWFKTCNAWKDEYLMQLINVK